MKIRTFMKASIVALLLSGVGVSGYAALTVIDDANARRVDSDVDAGGLTGTAVSPWALDVGHYRSNYDNTQAAFAFLMTGVDDPSIITLANFSVSLTQKINTSTVFKVDAHVIRTADNSTIIMSDYETSAQLLMSGFSVSTTPTGTVSLDAAGQEALGTWLKGNWVDGEYVFIGLKTDPLNIIPDDAAGWARVYRYSTADSGDWNEGRTDAQLTVIPEPGTIALLGLAGLAMFIRRRLVK